mmetsp:Transcript_23389/g.35029  ORF Transcript_23389/g.35029 Transcript_23389/m.35029 type:complete len:1574 (+) Transcript_23389:25-4746(+)
MDALSSPAELFNCLPDAKRESIVIISFSSSDEKQRIPLVHYVQSPVDGLQKIKETKEKGLRLNSNVQRVFLFVSVDNDARATQLAKDIEDQEGIKSTLISSALFLEKYSFLTLNPGTFPTIWYPAEILDGFLFVASKSQAKQTAQLKQLGITHILSCVRSSFTSDQTNNFKCEKLPSTDLRKGNFRFLFLLDNLRKSNGKVVVFDTKGENMCLALCIQYVMLREKKNLTESIEFVDARRSCGKISTNYREELQIFEKETRADPTHFSQESVSKKGSEASSQGKRSSYSSMSLSSRNSEPSDNEIINPLATFSGPAVATPVKNKELDELNAAFKMPDLERRSSQADEWVACEVIKGFLHVCVVRKTQNEATFPGIEKQISSMKEGIEKLSSDWARHGISEAIAIVHSEAESIPSESKKLVSLETELNVIVDHCSTASTNSFHESARSLYVSLEKRYQNENRFESLIDNSKLAPKVIVIGYSRACTLACLCTFLIHHQFESLRQVIGNLSNKMKGETMDDVGLTTPLSTFVSDYEAKVFNYNRSDSENLESDSTPRKYTMLAPRQFFNFLRNRVIATARARQTKPLVWDTRSSEKFQKEHLLAKPITAANLAIVPGEDMPNADQIYKLQTNIREKLAWKSWRFRDIILYGETSEEKGTTNSIQQLAAYLTTQLSRGTCWVLSDYYALKKKYPFLIKDDSQGSSPVAIASRYAVQTDWYPWEVLDGFLYFAEIKSVKLSQDFVTKIKEVGITHLISVNSDVKAPGIECSRVNITSPIVKHFSQYASVFKELETLRLCGIMNPKEASIFKKKKVIVCSAPKFGSSNPLAPPPKATYEAETLVLAYLMVIQSRTLGKTRQETQDFYLSMTPDWASLRAFGKKIKERTMENKNHTSLSPRASEATEDGISLDEKQKLIPEVHELNVHQTYNLISSAANLLILDLRSREEFQKGHIPRSVSLPLDKEIDGSANIQVVAKRLVAPEVESDADIENDRSSENMDELDADTRYAEPRDDSKEDCYQANVKKAFISSGKFRIIFISTNKDIENSLAAFLSSPPQVVSSRMHMFTLNGGVKAFKAAYPGLMQRPPLDQFRFDAPAPLPSAVIPGLLYLGTIKESTSLKTMKILNITREVVVSKYRRVYTFFPHKITYMRMATFPAMFESSAKLVCRFIDAGKRDHTATMIAGWHPDSAPASFALAYLIQANKLSMVDAYSQLEACRPTLSLGLRAARQVADFETEMLGVDDIKADEEYFDFQRCDRREPKEPSEKEANKFMKKVILVSQKETNKELKRQKELKIHSPNTLKFREDSEVQYLRDRLDKARDELEKLSEMRQELALENKTLRLKNQELNHTLETYKSHNEMSKEEEIIFGEDSDFESEAGTPTNKEATVKGESEQAIDTEELTSKIRSEIKSEYASLLTEALAKIKQLESDREDGKKNAEKLEEVQAKAKELGSKLENESKISEELRKKIKELKSQEMKLKVELSRANSAGTVLGRIISETKLETPRSEKGDLDVDEKFRRGLGTMIRRYSGITQMAKEQADMQAKILRTAEASRWSLNIILGILVLLLTYAVFAPY